MWDILSSPVWQSIGAATTMLSFLVYWRLKPRRELSWTVIAEQDIAEVRSDEVAFGKRVRVLFDDREVEHVRLGLIRIANTGNREIRADAFERPMELRAANRQGSDGEILLAEHAASVPDTIRTEISVSDGIARIKPLLLNPGDSFTVRCLEGGQRKVRLQLDSRIAGVSIVEGDDPQVAAESLQVTGLLFVMGGFIYYMVWAAAGVNIRAFLPGTVVVMFGGAALWVLGLARERRLRRLAEKLARRTAE
jgi:hypothetical protein